MREDFLCYVRKYSVLVDNGLKKQQQKIGNILLNWILPETITITIANFLQCYQTCGKSLCASPIVFQYICKYFRYVYSRPWWRWTQTETLLTKYQSPQTARRVAHRIRSLHAVGPIVMLQPNQQRHTATLLILVCVSLVAIMVVVVVFH